jgi:hypothetical protein
VHGQKRKRGDNIVVNAWKNDCLSYQFSFFKEQTLLFVFFSKWSKKKLFKKKTRFSRGLFPKSHNLFFFEKYTFPQRYLFLGWKGGFQRKLCRKHFCLKRECFGMFLVPVMISLA